MEEKLINLVQRYDYLYNMSSRHYMDIQMKNNAWNRIGTEMNKTGEECQKIWSNIRNNFRKALINRKSKSGDPYTKRRPIKYENELGFLKKFIQHRKKNSNLNSFSEDTQTSFAGESSVDGNEESAFSRMTYDSQHSLTTVEPTITEILNKYIEWKKELDPIDSFYHTMAATTKKLPEKVQVQIKRQIFNIVNDAEIKYIEENEIQSVSAPTQAPTAKDSTASTSGSEHQIPIYHFKTEAHLE